MTSCRVTDMYLSVMLTSTANVLRILIAFAVNTGAWTAAFSLLTLVLVRAVHRLSVIYPDPNTLAARPSENSVLRRARYPNLPNLLQYSTRQPQC